MFDEKARKPSQARKESLFPEAQRNEKFQMQNFKATWGVCSIMFYSAFSTHPYRDTSSCPVLACVVLQVPRQQLTFKEDCKPKPGEQLKHSWQNRWKHNTVSTASLVFPIQNVLLTSTYLQPLPLSSAAGWVWTKYTHIYQQTTPHPSTPPFKMGTLREWTLTKTSSCLNLKNTN